jgi:hypothetical protein
MGKFEEGITEKWEDLGNGIILFDIMTERDFGLALSRYLNSHPTKYVVFVSGGSYDGRVVVMGTKL